MCSTSAFSTVDADMRHRNGPSLLQIYKLLLPFPRQDHNWNYMINYQLYPHKLVNSMRFERVGIVYFKNMHFQKSAKWQPFRQGFGFYSSSTPVYAPDPSLLPQCGHVFVDVFVMSLNPHASVDLMTPLKLAYKFSSNFGAGTWMLIWRCDVPPSFCVN